MPKKVGDIGFPMVVHPRDPDTAWVFPMDGTDVWPRTRPAASRRSYRTRNGGKTWQRQDDGHAEGAGVVDGEAPGDAADGRSGGPVLRHHQRRALGARRGRIWKCLARHLPEIYAVETA